ncbi:MAG: tellurite resistance TerB family protein, partial [Rhodovarius sp.]|nr:tellurite resistance TerB family protein [Rhodovarius sp.]
MDLGKVLGALLSGAAAPPRRRARRGSGPFGLTRAETRQVGRALGALASVAAEALRQSQRGSPPPPPPAPPPRQGQGSPAPTPAPSAPRRLPDAGPAPPPGDPWAPRPGPTGPGDETAENREALLITRAMIAAARADGATDAEERAAIARQLDAAGLTPAERDQVLADFDRPLSPEEIAREARDPMLRAQIYAACYAAAGAISPAERQWLDRLAA